MAFTRTQGIVFFGFHAIVFLFSGAEPSAIYCLTLVSILIGFLVYNWPPAKIFMGDSGSYFIFPDAIGRGFIWVSGNWIPIFDSGINSFSIRLFTHLGQTVSR